MRKFKFKDGQFTFDILTDDVKIVVAKTKANNMVFTGHSELKENDTFDLHVGLQIAIRQCMCNLLSRMQQDVTKVLKSFEKATSNMKYFDREKFEEFRGVRLAKIYRQKTRHEAKMKQKQEETK